MAGGGGAVKIADSEGDCSDLSRDLRLIHHWCTCRRGHGLGSWPINHGYRIFSIAFELYEGNWNPTEEMVCEDMLVIKPDIVTAKLSDAAMPSPRRG